MYGDLFSNTVEYKTHKELSEETGIPPSTLTRYIQEYQPFIDYLVSSGKKLYHPKAIEVLRSIRDMRSNEVDYETIRDLLASGGNTRETKACTKCKRELPVAMFYKHKKAPDGLQWWCKDCLNDYRSSGRKDGQEVASTEIIEELQAVKAAVEELRDVVGGLLSGEMVVQLVSKKPTA